MKHILQVLFLIAISPIITHGQDAPYSQTELNVETSISPVVMRTDHTPIADLDDPFKKFEQQRKVGKFTQLIGAALLSTSVYLLAKYRDEDINAGRNYEPKKVPSELVLAGGTFLVVGLWIDINAGRHLKKK